MRNLKKLPIDKDTMNLIRGIYPDAQINYYVKIKKERKKKKDE